MIHPDMLPFLKELKENNNREWFAENKTRYNELRHCLNDFADRLILRMQVIDNELRGLDAKDCIFRIYRDVRFSADKSPYKTNMGTWIVRGGKKSNFAGYYFHIEPDNCFISGGVYMPETSVLKAIRTDIYENIEEFLPIIQDKNFVSVYGGKLDNEGSLTRPPKGFSADFPYIDLIKLKNFTATSPFETPYLQDEVLEKEIIRRFSALLPFNHYLNRIIENI
jgi:uncharacterized protein (TIGR02453 family)